MALVPAEMATQSNIQQHLPSGPILNQLSSLDQQMKAILDDSYSTPENKLSQYYNVLRRYDTMQDTAAHTPVPVKIYPPAVLQKTMLEEKQQPVGKVQLPVTESEILEHVPKNQRNNAKLLISYIKENPSLSWNQNKEMIYNGNKIEGSNIFDLISDMTRNRKSASPAIGWQEFTKALMQENVPRQAVGNNQRWEYIVKQRKTPQKFPEYEDDDEDVFESPVAKLQFTPAPSALRQQTMTSGKKSTPKSRKRKNTNRYDAMYTVRSRVK